VPGRGSAPPASVELVIIGKVQPGREQMPRRKLPTWFSTCPFSHPQPRARHRLNQVMRAHLQEPPIEMRFLPDEHGIHRRFMLS